MIKDRYLGLDYGGRRIGYSLSDETNTIAFGKGVFNNSPPMIYKKIVEFISQNNITHIIIGHPIGLSGKKTKITLEVESFMTELISELNKQNINAEVILYDERFTSKIATDSMISSGMKKKKRQDKQNLDIISSSLILQSYLDGIKK